MSEEAAFIEALTKDTLDDVTRGVYADWLEERGDSRAAFLRAEIALSELEGDFRWFEAAAVVPRSGIDSGWAGTVAPRWDLWAIGGHYSRKIHAIKAIRELTGMGLAEAKSFVEGPLPARVKGGYASGDALRAALHLRDAFGHGLAGFTGRAVELRRSTALPFVGWVGSWQPPPVPSPPGPAPPISVWLRGYPPHHKIELIKLIRELTGMGLAEAKAYVEQPPPICLRASLSVSEAEGLRQRFAPWAAVELRTS